MNVDCLLMILETMNFSELVNMSQANNHFAILADNVFKRRFAEKTIKLVGPFSKDSSNGLTETSDEITFQNYNLALAVLLKFGRRIKHLDINYKHISTDQRQEINELINRQSFQSLVSLALRKLDDTVLQKFQYPFANVQNVTITGELRTSNNASKLRELFPAVRRLNLTDLNVHDVNILDVELPQLKHLTVEIPILSDMSEAIEKLEKRNPQITELTMYYCTSFDYLQMASQNLPNLESLKVNLEILGDEYSGGKIHFPNVKKLATNWGEFDFTKVIKFDELNELDLTCEACEGAKFAAQSKNLNHLHLSQHSLKETEVNLSELSIDHMTNVHT